MADRAAPVGVMDSGVGGLSVLAEIQRLLPNESLLYVADSGHVPYGEKSPDYIRQRLRHIAAFFHEQGAKAMVLACNTATVAAVADLRELYPDWPLVGMEPAVKPAAAATRSGVVGVLATTGTLQSAKFAALLDRFASDVRVVTQPCPGLVERIETGDLTSPELRQLLLQYVQPLLAAGCDTLILGCTHYPFLRPMLATMVPADVAIIDTGAAVARQLQRLLGARDLLSDQPARATAFWSSGEPAGMQKVLPLLWTQPASVQRFLP
ncbi:glutamate racemase [Pseudomonas sp. GD03858]|uniref:glutamate racemase n=1 Tax=unclassified Pseudomonas TaxID=196821 RepID=UPI0024468DCF|nr:MULTISPECIES: glutamate racemase [unclassified Pseudomonas]MDH0645506.1 glutamate racemase [Pseudomonas sp. GD03867]MDH0662632.1 glutamate racemase [Pseudomonas sp. GD03858]